MLNLELVLYSMFESHLKSSCQCHSGSPVSRNSVKDDTRQQEQFTCQDALLEPGLVQDLRKPVHESRTPWGIWTSSGAREIIREHWEGDEGDGGHVDPG